MNAEFFEALTMLEKERGLTAEYLIEKIKAAIVIAVKKDYEVEDENVLVEIDTVNGKFNVSLVRDIVEEVENPHTQLTLEEAQAIRKTYKMGQRVVTPLKTKDFGRIAAQTAKHVIRQGIREAERNQLFNDMQGKAHEIVTARVTRVDPDRGLVALDMGKGEAILPRSEQVPGEEFFEGQHVQVYVKDVVVTERGPRVIISRTSEQLVKRMFEMEVPEIFDGTVEIRAISREAGVRTKMAVWSKDENIDPVGACIGAHGARVGKIVEELHGEKIDVVRWSEELERGCERVHQRRPEPRQGGQGGDPGRRQEGLPRHRARPSAEPGHRQQGPECPSVRPPDRLQYRYPPRERLLRRGRGAARCFQRGISPSPQNHQQKGASHRDATT